MTDDDLIQENKGIPISASDINHEDYWFIEAQGVEWVYVVQELIKKHLAEVDIKEKPVIITSALGSGVPVFILRKKFLPAEAIALATGIALDIIMSTPTLKLSLTPKDLPAASVNYWGTA